jgi:hypothetical protein
MYAQSYQVPSLRLIPRVGLYAHFLLLSFIVINCIFDKNNQQLRYLTSHKHDFFFCCISLNIVLCTENAELFKAQWCHYVPYALTFTNSAVCSQNVRVSIYSFHVILRINSYYLS